MKFIDKIKMIKNYLPFSRFYFYSLARRNRPLLGLFFQVTDKCNAKCMMCFNWQKLNKPSSELSLDEIEKFAKNIGHIPNLTIGGGEPFLRDDLPEICQIFCKNNQTKRISIPTNSLLLDRIITSTERMLKSSSARIAIILSLDGVKGVHDYIRGVEGTFDKFLEVYKNLKELSKKYPKLKININTTISDKNFNNIAELINFVDSNLKVDFHTIETIRGSYNQENVQAPSTDEYQQLIGQILKGKTINNDKYHKAIYSYYHKMALNILIKKKQLIPCRASSFMSVIDAIGNVYNCELLPTIGNLRDSNYDFLKIWQSDKAKKQRKDIANKRCYCTHFCYQIQNIPMSPLHLLKAVFFNKYN